MVDRLKRRSDFLRVAALKCKWATPGLILQAAPIPQPSLPPTSVEDGVAYARPPVGEPSMRVGFTCSKKVGNSVARNRARRRLRAAAAQILPSRALPGYDYVLIGRQETLHRPFALLLQDLLTALKRVGTIRKDGPAGTLGRDRQNGREVP